MIKREKRLAVTMALLAFFFLHGFATIGSAQSPTPTPTTSASPTPSPSPSPADDADPQSTDQGGAKGVNPADNITKIEILPKVTMLDDDISITTVTLKYDKALGPKWGFNVELPIARFDSPFGGQTGIGDTNFRLRYTYKAAPRITLIVGGEAVFPTATKTSLGSGKFQINPTVAAVYQVNKNTFVAGAVKQLISIAGKEMRENIRQGQFRAIVGYIAPTGWWALADPQVWVDYRKGGRTEFAPEFEVGKMVLPTVGLFFRTGGHVAGSWQRQDWSIGGGIRFLTF